MVAEGRTGADGRKSVKALDALRRAVLDMVADRMRHCFETSVPPLPPQPHDPSETSPPSKVPPQVPPTIAAAVTTDCVKMHDEADADNSALHEVDSTQKDDTQQVPHAKTTEKVRKSPSKLRAAGSVQSGLWPVPPNALQFTQIASTELLGNHYDHRGRWGDGIGTVAWSSSADLHSLMAHQHDKESTEHPPRFSKRAKLAGTEATYSSSSSSSSPFPAGRWTLIMKRGREEKTFELPAGAA